MSAGVYTRSRPSADTSWRSVGVILDREALHLLLVKRAASGAMSASRRLEQVR